MGEGTVGNGAMAVLGESSLKVKVPALPGGNCQDVSLKPRPSREPEASLFSESVYVPFKTFGESHRVGGGPNELDEVCPSRAAVNRVGRGGGAGERRWGQRLQRAPRGPVTPSFPQRPRRAGHLG